MKKILIIVLALVLSLCALSSCGEKKDTLKVAMECNYAPFNWTQSESNDRTVKIGTGGYADGYDVQIAKKIADGLGRELEIVKIEWDGLTPAIQSGAADLIIAGMSPTAERSLTIDFSDPYYESDLVIVVKKDGAFASAASIADFSGAKITGQLNTFHYSVIDQIAGVQKETAMETFSAMIVALNAGTIDGYVSERPGAKSAVAANPDLAFVEFTAENGFQASKEDVAIAVGLKKGSDLTTQINEILAKITTEERQTMMDEALANQPLSE